MLQNNLYNILSDLKNMRTQDAFNQCVLNRLERSLEMYSDTANLACDYIQSRATLKAMRNIDKYGRKENLNEK